MRKVRAPQDRITDNVRRRRLPGKCNRNSLPKLPEGSRYRWKGEVKAHRHGRRLRANVNPIRSNTVCGVAPAIPHEPLFAVRRGPWRQARCRSGIFRGWLQAHGNVRRRQMAAARHGAYRTRLTSPLKKTPRQEPWYFFNSRLRRVYHVAAAGGDISLLHRPHPTFAFLLPV